MSLDLDPAVIATGPSEKSSRRIVTWLAVLLACTSALAVWQAVRVGRLEGQTIETVNDLTITKTSQELMRQAALPVGQQACDTAGEHAGWRGGLPSGRRACGLASARAGE